MEERQSQKNISVTNPFLTPVQIIEPKNKLPDYTFDNLPENLKKTLQNHGWNDLMPVQRKTIPYMLAARDMLIQSKTGSGKTGAFVLPLLQVIEPSHPYPQALILVPTRELALQVHSEIEKLADGTGIRSIAIFGGVSYEPQVKALKANLHIIVATPGRLIDLANRGCVDFLSVRDLVMDEADEMLSMGFYPDMQRIRKMLPKEIACTMFSATIPQTVKSLAREFQRASAEFLSLSYNRVIANNLEHRYYPCDVMDKDSQLVKIIEWENPKSCMVFCNMKRDVSYLEQVLKNNGFSAAALSGDVPQKLREETLEAFRTKKINILICTDVAARGIDVDHVTHVIVYDHPEDHEVYVHRSGRTARAGKSGLAISLITPVEEIELQKTAVDFGIEFHKMEPLTEDDLALRARERLENVLLKEKTNIKPLEKIRLKRYDSLIDEWCQKEDLKEIIAHLLDSHYRKTELFACRKSK